MEKPHNPTVWNIITDNPNVTTSEIIAQCRKLFPIYVYSESEVDLDFPAPKKKTTRTFAPNVEADENLENESYNDLQKGGIEGITLRERLIMEIQYFKETGKNLDIENITLCSGSLYRDDGVPGVDFDGGEVSVGWYGRGNAGGFLRSRQCGSKNLSPSPLVPLTPTEIVINGISYILTKK